jgi:hypothetical protein
MKKRLATAVVPLLLLILTGCGGGGDGNSSASAAKKLITSTVQCDAAGINEKQGKTGTCSRDGVTYTVVDKAQTLQLEELDAKVLKDEVTKVLKGQSKFPARQGHKWVVVNMQVKNKLDKPQRVGGPGFEQLTISSGKAHFLEVPSTVLNNSFFELGAIPAGGVKTGFEVFEVTDKFARDFPKLKVDLDIVNFSEAGFIDQAKHVGVIRLWK